MEIYLMKNGRKGFKNGKKSRRKASLTFRKNVKSLSKKMIKFGIEALLLNKK
jgi:hypothetical protein